MKRIYHYILLSVLLFAIAGCSDHRYEVDLSKATVYLTVTDINGVPVAGAEIGTSAMVGSEEFPHTEKTTDASGRICFDNLGPSDYIFYHICDKLGLKADTLRVTVEGNRTYDFDFVLKMEPETAKTGNAVLTVKDGSGNPLGGADISLFKIENGKETELSTTSSDNLNGVIKYYNLAPGDYKAKGGYGIVQVEGTVEAGKTSEWEMTIDLILEKLPKDTWSILYCSSWQKTPDLSPENLIDGKVSTYWNSSWAEPQDVRPTHPHIIDIDMGDVRTFFGFILTDAGAGYYSNGPKDFEMLISNDGKTWTSVGRFTQPQATSAAQEETVHPISGGAVSARYIRFYSIDQYTTTLGATLTFAELDVFTYINS